jgi:hypothetical protein
MYMTHNRMQHIKTNIATSLQAERPRNRSSIYVRGKRFFFRLHNVQTGSGDPSSFLLMGTAGYGFPSGLFLSGFPTNILYAFVIHALPISSSLT